MEKTGESTRQLKVAKEIQKVMAEIIRSKGMAAFGGALVSVSGVKVSPDLSVAKIYVSVFPSEKAEAVMGTLEENGKALRGELGSKMGKQLREPKPDTEAIEPVYQEANYDVVRVKKFAMKPMEVDDAITQMELLGHNFFLFMNSETETMNVLYRRNDGSYGLLVPEE